MPGRLTIHHDHLLTKIAGQAAWRRPLPQFRMLVWVPHWAITSFLPEGSEEVLMQGSSDSGEDAERIARHAERPGFRISELRMSPTQRVPWHYHTHIQDTFYVLDGSVRINLRDPHEQVELKPGESWGPVRPGRPHLVTNSGGGSATFLVLQGIGDWDHIPLA